MRNRVVLACVSCVVWGAVACSSNSSGPPEETTPDATSDATSDGAGGSSGGASEGGSSGSSGGSVSDGGSDAADSTVESEDADATVPEAGAEGGAVEASVSDAEAGIPLPSYCGAWTGTSANTTETYVSATLKLSAAASGAAPENLGYTWTQSEDAGVVGVFGATSDEAAGTSDAMSFLCTAPGTTTVTLTVDEGPLPDGGSCPTSLTTTSLDITCDPYPSTQVEAAWVELGSTGSANTDGGSIVGTNTVIARVITGAATCPTITLNGGSPTSMNQRVAAGTIPLRVTTSTSLGPQYSKPSVFPVQTCELALPSGTTSATVNAALPGGSAGIDLALPKANAQTIVVIGDTGCRMQYSPPTTASDGGVIINAQWQSCTDPTQYTFAATAALAASFNPDLVIHVGDYEYRDNECPPDVAGCAGEPWGYGWDAWQADFFKPAQPLLKAAPWIVNRGNHESCTRSGQGWFRFLDTNGYDTVPGKDCNSQGAAIANDAGGGFAGDNIGGYNTPYAVQVRADTQVMTFDTNNIAKAAIAPTGTNGNMYAAYATELEQMGALPQAGMFNIWTNHHAILGFANSPPVASPGVALISVMEAVYPDTLFPPGTNMALHGHTHLFEAIDETPTATDAGVPNNYPATFVSGNAGTLLDTDLPGTFPAVSAAPTAIIPPEVANIAHSPDFGFLLMQYQPADGSTAASWLLTEYKLDGTPLTQCTATMDGQTTCTNWGDLF